MIRRVARPMGQATALTISMAVSFLAAVPRADEDSSSKQAERESASTDFSGWQAKYETNLLGMKLAQVPAGSTILGSPTTEAQRDFDENQRVFEVAKPFLMSAYEVTQEEFKRVMGFNPSAFKDPKYPVESITRVQAVDFCWRLSAIDGRIYRLPTENEWEYACRAGTSTPFHFGASLTGKQAAILGTSPFGSSEWTPVPKSEVAVGSFAPNRFGLFDMHGNVSELCSGFATDLFDANKREDSNWPPAIVYRGGNWYERGANSRAAARSEMAVAARSSVIGFRVVTDQLSHEASKNDAERERPAPFDDRTIARMEAPDAETVAFVGKLAEALPGSPVPQGEQIPTNATMAVPLQRWLRRITLDIYRRFGQKSPAWDAYVETSFDEWANYITTFDEEAGIRGREARGKAVAAGCSDPVLLYLVAADMPKYDLERKRPRLLSEAVEALEKSKYPKAIAFQGAMRLANWHREAGNAPEGKRWFDRALQLLVDSLHDDSFTPEESRALLWVLSGIDSHDNMSQWSVMAHFPVIAQRLENEPSFDPWVFDILAGHWHLKTAWLHRGDGWANEVTNDGWKGFVENLQQSRNHFVRAWRMNPDLPDSASPMIQVTMGGASVADEGPRFWFDQTVRAQVDFMPAYYSLLWSLRPRWGGSYEEMLAFGRDCIDSGRFEIDVPFVFYDAVNDIGSEMQDRTHAFRLPGVFDDFKRLYEPAIAAAKSPRVRHRLAIKYAGVAYLCGRADIAANYRDELGPADVFDLSRIGVDYEILRQELAEPRKDGLQDSFTRVIDLTREPRSAILASNGRFIGIATGYGPLLWDRERSRPRIDFPTFVRRWSPNYAAPSPNGDMMAVSFRPANSVASEISLYSVNNPYAPSTIDSAQMYLPYVCFSPDGKLLAALGNKKTATGETGSAIIWDVVENRLVASLQGNYLFFQRACFLPDSKQLVLAGGAQNRPAGDTTGQVVVWNVAEGRQVQMHTTSTETYYCLDISPDGRTVAVAGSLNKEPWNAPASIHLLDIETLKERRSLTTAAPTILALRFSPDGKRLAVAEEWGEVTILDAETGAHMAQFIGQSGNVRSLDFSSDGGQLITASTNAGVQVWQLGRTGVRSRLSQSLRYYSYLHSYLSRMKLSPDEKTLAVTAIQSGTLTWNLADKGVGANLLAAGEFHQHGIVVTRDGRRILGCIVEPKHDRDAVVEWDVATGNRLRQFPGGSGGMSTVAQSPDGKLLATCHPARSVTLYDFVSGREVEQFEAHARQVNSVDFSPDGKLLVTGGEDSTAKLWEVNASKNEPRKPLIVMEGHTASVNEACFAPIGELVAVSSWDGTVDVWDIKERKKRFSVPGFASDFSADATTIVTGGGKLGKEIAAWDAVTGSRLKTYSRLHASPISCLVLSKSTPRVFSLDQSGVLKSWMLTSGEEDWDFAVEQKQ